jgi:predicted DNA-binding transcriptional regulator AlpA
MPDHVVLTEAEFCETVRISRTKCWRLRRAGRLPYLRIGDRIGFLQKHVDAFLESCEQGTPNSEVRPKALQESLKGSVP